MSRRSSRSLRERIGLGLRVPPARGTRTLRGRQTRRAPLPVAPAIVAVVALAVTVVAAALALSPSRDAAGLRQAVPRQAVPQRKVATHRGSSVPAPTAANAKPGASVGGAATGGTPSGSRRGGASGTDGSLSLAQMLGRMIVARFAGPYPPASFLTAIEAGRIGGVILFADNVAGGPDRTRAMLERLQVAARRAGNWPLLIMTDQEGGEVRRLSWAPPTLAPSAMRTSAIARRQGEITGDALREAGVNVDLAPVADVERVSGSFLGTRSFGSTPVVVAKRACAFAEGVASAGVAFTLKHFPGLGRALTSTDVQPTTIEATRDALREDYRAYRVCGGERGALVMVSSAGYPSLTGTSAPAVLSQEIYRQELPFATGGTEPVTISDDLQTAAIVNEVTPAQRAINDGLDLLMYAQTESGSSSAYERLLAVARSNGVDRIRLELANEAIATLKQWIAGQGAATAASATEASAEEASAEEAPYHEYTGGEPVTITPSTHSRAGG